MALIDLKFYSETLRMQTRVYVVLPQPQTQGEIGVERARTEGKHKCLYLLHGLSDDESIWLRRTSIERYADEYGICVVMPCGDTSFYTDMKYGKKYYTYIAKELPRLICQFFNVSEKREDTYIAGISMGGYGALKIGLRECDRFCMAAGLSSVTDPVIPVFSVDNKDVMTAVFGDKMVVPEMDDLFWLLEQRAKHPLRPRVFMGVGTEDFLYEDNIRLKNRLQELEYDYVYKESPGLHCWTFWDEYIIHVLNWMFRDKV